MFKTNTAVISKGQPIQYERINFFKEFNNTGQVEKVLSLIETKYKPYFECDVFNYDDRERTEIPCVDKEVFIVCDFANGVNTYTLVQVDFSISSKLKILTVSDSKKSKNPKEEIYKFMAKNGLVQVKTEGMYSKKPQIDKGFGSMFIQILEGLIKKENKGYQQEELLQLLLDNTSLSVDYGKVSAHFGSKEMFKQRFEQRSIKYLELIYSNAKSDVVALSEVINLAKEYKKNYDYNL